jgi:translation initiation factor IF-3
MIRVKEVAVIATDGEQMGTFPTREAIALAQDQDMDLVEVSPNANPPVCRIMDWGKHKYKANKRAHEAKKNQKFKVKHVQRFLEAGDKAKVVIFFKGREIVHRDGGERVLKRVAEAMEEYGTIEQSSKQEGRTLTMILVPKVNNKKETKSS